MPDATKRHNSSRIRMWCSGYFRRACGNFTPCRVASRADPSSASRHSISGSGINWKRLGVGTNCGVRQSHWPDISTTECKIRSELSIIQPTTCRLVPSGSVASCRLQLAWQSYGTISAAISCSSGGRVTTTRGNVRSSRKVWASHSVAGKARHEAFRSISSVSSCCRNSVAWSAVGLGLIWVPYSSTLGPRHPAGLQLHETHHLFLARIATGN